MAKRKTAPSILFEDSFELEHVLDSLRECAKLAKLAKSNPPLRDWRGNSPLPVIERRLETMYGHKHGDDTRDAIHKALFICDDIETPSALAAALPKLEKVLRDVAMYAALERVGQERDSRRAGGMARQRPKREIRAQAERLAKDFHRLKPSERIGEAVAYVMAGLAQCGIPPQRDEQVRKWIRPFFPAGARRPGRPRKM